MKIPNDDCKVKSVYVSLARIVSEDSQHSLVQKDDAAKSSKDS